MKMLQCATLRGDEILFDGFDFRSRISLIIAVNLIRLEIVPRGSFEGHSWNEVHVQPRT